MRAVKLLWVSHILALSCAPAAGAPALFASHDILDVELRGPLNDTLKDTEDREERPFELRVDGQTVEVEVRVRGKSRVESCGFPPLRFDFAGSETMGTAFEGQGALKVVTHCRQGRRYEENVFEEYAAYRVYSMLTDKAFRVRLLRIRYVDNERRKSQVIERHAFVIEAEKALAARIGATNAKLRGTLRSRLDAEHIADVFVFQYLIGNTDWSLVAAEGEDECCHNGLLVEIDDMQYYVPYDFDRAGVVDPSYTKPGSEQGKRSWPRRRYRGYCFDELDLASSIRRIRALRDEIFGMLEGLPDADSGSHRRRIRYFDIAFREMEDVDDLVSKFEKSCIGG